MPKSTFVPRLDNLAASTVKDQAGQEKLVILGIDAHGHVWVKPCGRPWQKVSRDAEPYEASARI